MSHPFGTEISTDDILDALSFFDTWEERYKYIIDLGKQLPAMDESERTEDRIVKGCQSKVWIKSEKQNDVLLLEADSDAFIVKGLLAVVLAAYHAKPAAEALVFDIDAYFEQLQLVKHLSPTRGNGLLSMVAKIKELAAA